MPGLVLVTDPDAPGGLVPSVERALGRLDHRARGVVAVQLRAKDWPAGRRREAAIALRGLTRRRGGLLLINGDPALASAVGADGVQLPEGGPAVPEARAVLGPGKIVGVSRHDAEGLRRAAAEGAGFALLSPVFAVPGKGAPLGLEGFRAIARASTIPVLGLGGIDPDNAAEVMGSGAVGVAVQRSAFRGADPAGTVRALLSAVVDARRGNGRG